MRLKLLIADDHQLMLEAIRMALADAPDIEIVGETNSGAQVLPLVRQTSPDVVLLDLRMPGMDGLRCLEALRQRHPDVKTVVLSGSEEPEVIEAAFQRGAAAFIVKRIDPADLRAGDPAGVRRQRLLSGRDEAGRGRRCRVRADASARRTSSRRSPRGSRTSRSPASSGSPSRRSSSTSRTSTASSRSAAGRKPSGTPTSTG